MMIMMTERSVELLKLLLAS